MKRLSKLFLITGVLCFTCFAFPQEIKLVDSGSDDLKDIETAAQVMFVPVEKLKKARQILQEAIDQARRVKPLPVSQMFFLVEISQQLNPSKSKETIDFFIQDLRSQAANAKDLKTYQKTTSTAMLIVQFNGVASGSEKQLQFIKSWPEASAAVGEAGMKYRRSLENSIRQSMLHSIAHSDPLKAKNLLAEVDGSPSFKYSIAAQIVQGLIGKAKKDEALALVNQTINDFSRNPSDPQSFQAYQSFARLTIRTLGSENANAVLAPLITQLMNQAPSDKCISGTMKAGDKSIDLTCSEYGAYNLIQGILQMPDLAATTLSSFPSLKSKLDQAGGVVKVFSRAGVTVAPKVPENYLEDLRNKAKTGIPFSPEYSPNMMAMYGGGMPFSPEFNPEMMAMYGGGAPFGPEFNPEMMAMYGGGMPFGPDYNPEMMAAIYGGGSFGPGSDPDEMDDYMDFMDLVGGALPFGFPFDPALGVGPEEMSAIYQSYLGSMGLDETVKYESYRSATSIMKELKEKAGSNPGLVREKLQEIAKGENGLETLMCLATLAYDKSDFSKLLLEVAKPLVSQGEPIEKRAMLLQFMFFANRQINKTTDPELLSKGFVLADELRAKAQKPGDSTALGKGNMPVKPNQSAWMPGRPLSPDREADRMEIFLISEVAKDNVDKAVDYARSRKSDNLKLRCLIQIIQSLINIV